MNLKDLFKSYNSESISEDEIVVQDPNLSVWNLNELCEKYNLGYEIERDFMHNAMYYIYCKK